MDNQGKTVLEPGDVLCADKEDSNKVVACQNSYDDRLVSVVSTSPHLTMGAEHQGEDAVRMALSGRVPIKVSLENGPIASGDYLTSSSALGVAMKATKPGRVVGMALESYGFDKSQTPNLKSQTNPNDQNPNDQNNCSKFGICDLEFGASLPIGKVMVFVNPGFSLGSLTDEGLIASGENSAGGENNGESQNEQPTILNQFTLAVKNSLEKLGILLENGIAQVKEIFAGKVTTKQLCIEGEDGEVICVEKDQLKELLNKSQIPNPESQTSPNNQTPNLKQIPNSNDQIPEINLNTSASSGQVDQTPSSSQAPNSNGQMSMPTPAPMPMPAPTATPMPEPTPSSELTPALESTPTSDGTGS